MKLDRLPRRHLQPRGEQLPRGERADGRPRAEHDRTAYGDLLRGPDAALRRAADVRGRIGVDREPRGRGLLDYHALEV